MVPGITNVGIVGCTASPKIDTARTANTDRAVMMIKQRALVDEILLHQWHILQTVHMPVLIVCQNEEDIRFLRCIAESCESTQQCSYESQIHDVDHFDQSIDGAMINTVKIVL